MCEQGVIGVCCYRNSCRRQSITSGYLVKFPVPLTLTDGHGNPYHDGNHNGKNESIEFEFQRVPSWWFRLIQVTPVFGIVAMTATVAPIGPTIGDIYSELGDAVSRICCHVHDATNMTRSSIVQ